MRVRAMSGIVVAGCTFFLGTTARAALLASDTASDPAYAGGNYAGLNGGTGFGAWSVSGSGGTFIGDSSNNGTSPSGNINTSLRSFGFYGGNGTPVGETAVRPLIGNLLVSQIIKADFDNGFIDTGFADGISFGNASGARFTFQFPGGASTYQVIGSTTQNTTHTFTADGMRTSFTLTGADTYSFTVTYNTGTPTSETFTGTLGGTSGSGIDRITLFNNQNHGNPAWDAYANSLSVTPEPGTLGLAGFAALGLLARRRRA
jgi:hypothetical protein